MAKSQTKFKKKKGSGFGDDVNLHVWGLILLIDFFPTVHSDEILPMLGIINVVLMQVNTTTAHTTLS